MESQEQELIDRLAPENPELQEANAEHTRLKARVEKLTSKVRLSPADELQKKELQKLKLAEKDKIVRILAEHRKEVGEQQRA
ncbi:MAG: hypothetical protein ACI8TX_001013 [Hyphomicrobiaceae bacterium]|jgi:uncharacterized protein YdcH (DUF465 family)